ncbi:hypothetical protein ACN28E_33900 [Archangium lansingense]|uniref:hypothetical protein n=1 Tax=Archangium lansingense TaxID=2995310 RepID=UPI003B7A9029
MRWSILLLGMVMTGCVFRGYQASPPSKSLWRPVSSGKQADFSAYFYQPSHEDNLALQSGLTEVHSLFQNEEFRELVRRYNDWIVQVPACTVRSSNGSVEYAITGDSVVQYVLSYPFLGVHYLVNRHLGAVATTEISRNATAINPWQVAKWRSTDPRIRAEFINTLAHELTHLVPMPHSDSCVFNDETHTSCDKGHSAMFRYTDEGHNTCTERRLVSYRLGDMAGCYYQLGLEGTAVSTEKGLAHFERCMEEARKLSPADILLCTARIEESLAQCRAEQSTR